MVERGDLHSSGAAIEALASPGSTVSGLAQRLVDEGLRMSEHPGIVFEDGTSGRRAALALGPDVWEVVEVLGEMDERGDAEIAQVDGESAAAEARGSRTPAACEP